MNKSHLYFSAGLVVSSLLISGVTRASAQASHAEQACTPDVMRLCNEYIPRPRPDYRLPEDQATPAEPGMLGCDVA
jgi:hypothetical protein